MTEWTCEQVEERLHEAADVMKRLPAIKVQGYYNLWPGIVREFADLVGQEPPRLRRPFGTSCVSTATSAPAASRASSTSIS